MLCVDGDGAIDAERRSLDVAWMKLPIVQQDHRD